MTKGNELRFEPVVKFDPVTGLKSILGQCKCGRIHCISESSDGDWHWKELTSRKRKVRLNNE